MLNVLKALVITLAGPSYFVVSGPQGLSYVEAESASEAFCAWVSQQNTKAPFVRSYHYISLASAGSQERWNLVFVRPSILGLPVHVAATEVDKEQLQSNDTTLCARMLGDFRMHDLARDKLGSENPTKMGWKEVSRA